MASLLSPAEARQRRHMAAMKVVRHVPADERWQLLFQVCWPSPAVEAACEAAAEARLERKRARKREEVCV